MCRIRKRSGFNLSLPELRKRSGFTIVELLVVLLISVILATLAVSGYTIFMKQMRARGAESDLMMLSGAMSSYYAQQLSYPNQTTSTSQTQSSLPVWSPTEQAYFSYYILSSTQSGYVLSAVGIAGSMMEGYSLQMDSTNQKAITVNGGSESW